MKNSRTRLKASAALPAVMLLLVANSALAQEADHAHCSHHEDHFHARELGLSAAPVWFVGSDESVKVGLHGHFIQRLGESPFGVGVGVEYIADEHRHQTYSAVFQWTPLPALHLVAAPGVALEQEVAADGTASMEAGWACHLEVVREFGLGRLDIGPAFEWALDAHGSHAAIGVHLGIPFE